jgi:hypothetical protein
MVLNTQQDRFDHHQRDHSWNCLRYCKFFPTWLLCIDRVLTITVWIGTLCLGCSYQRELLQGQLDLRQQRYLGPGNFERKLPPEG